MEGSFHVVVCCVDIGAQKPQKVDCVSETASLGHGVVQRGTAVIERRSRRVLVVSGR